MRRGRIGPRSPCLVTSARKHITKNKQLMMFAQWRDLTGSVEVTVFSRVYEATAPLWGRRDPPCARARRAAGEDPKLLCEHAVRFRRMPGSKRSGARRRAPAVPAKRRTTSRNGNGGARVYPGQPAPVQTGGGVCPRRLMAGRTRASSQAHRPLETPHPRHSHQPFLPTLSMEEPPPPRHSASGRS